jgi:hypothetical protein
MQGVIRGEEYEANCTIRATKVSLPGTSDSAYTDYSIEQVSKPPPGEGKYTVTAGSENIRVRFRNGQWLAAE